MEGKRKVLNRQSARVAAAFRKSWSAVLVLILGFAAQAPVVRCAVDLLLAPTNQPDIATEYLKAQLRNTQLDLVVQPGGGLALVSDGPRSGNPLIKARETPFTITGSGDPDLVVGAAVAPITFSRVCPKPILGRVLQPSDESGRQRVVVLSERLWRRRFAADPALIGKSITLNDRGYIVIGVMPASFWFPYRSDPVELWVPEHNLSDPTLLIT
jgi:putative ABC transport system permease protein